MIQLVTVASAALVLAAVYLCATELFALRYRRLAQQRRGEAGDDLQTHFRRVGVHADVLAAVHQFFQQFTAVRGFPVRASDNLFQVYGMQREDVRDAVAVLAADAHCLSAEVTQPATSAGVSTVEDLVHVVDRMHRKHASGEPVGVRLRQV